MSKQLTAEELRKTYFTYNLVSSEVLCRVWVKTETGATSLKCRKRRKQNKCYFEPCDFWINVNFESKICYTYIHLEYYIILNISTNGRIPPNVSSTLKWFRVHMIQGICVCKFKNRCTHCYPYIHAQNQKVHNFYCLQFPTLKTVTGFKFLWVFFYHWNDWKWLVIVIKINTVLTQSLRPLPKKGRQNVAHYLGWSIGPDFSLCFHLYALWAMKSLLLGSFFPNELMN